MSNAEALLVPSSWAIAVATAGVCSMWLTVATMTQSICSAEIPALSIALRAAATLMTWTVSSGAGPATLPDPRALLDPLVTGVDRRDDLGVGDHARGAIAADPEDRGVL